MTGNIAHNRKDLTGQRFGKLTVVGLDSIETIQGTKRPLKRTLWKCICDCGIEKIMTSAQVKRLSCGCAHKLPPGEALFRTVLDTYQRHAKRRNQSFDLTRDQFRELTQRPCFYCGTELSNYSQPRSGMVGGFKYNGVDRIDNDLGYTEENSVPCCKNCNMMKKNLPVYDFLRHIDIIFVHQYIKYEWTLR